MPDSRSEAAARRRALERKRAETRREVADSEPEAPQDLIDETTEAMRKEMRET